MSDRPGRRLSPLTPLVRSSILVVAALASTWNDLIDGRLGPVAVILLVVLVAGAVFGAASWLRTRYWIEDDELRVDTGVISRQSRRIRVDRLQGIDIVQPLVARLFGLAELKLDVAGGGDEGSLAYLPLAEARDLRQTLLARRDAVREERSEPSGPTGPTGATGPPPAPATPRAATEDRVVARLDLATLLLSLVLAPETVLFAAAGVVLAVVMTVFFGAWGEVGGIAGLVPIVGGFALTQLRKLAAFYGFTVLTTEAGLQVRRGLFELSTQTIALARVQGLVMTEPWTWRWFGWAKLDVAVAGYARSERDGRPSASTVLPVGPRAEVLALARTLLEDAGSPDLEAVPLSGPPRRARWVAPVRARFLLGGIDEHLLVSREGLLTRRTHVVPHARVQSLQVHQGPWQRRLALADLRVDSPPGPVKVRIRHREDAGVRSLLDQAHERARAARAGASSV